MASHMLRSRASIYDIRHAYDAERSSGSSSENERTHQDDVEPHRSDATTSTPSSTRKPVIHQIERQQEPNDHQTPFFDDRPAQESPSSSAESFTSTNSSREDVVVEPTPDLGLPEFTATAFRSSVVPATPADFSELFPSCRRLEIRHDDTSSDGNMNLRVDTEVPFSASHTGHITLFHLRMYDLKTRDFSLRRYCRDSGREVCHTLRKVPKPSVDKRPGLQRSLSNAISSMRGKSESRSTADPHHLKRNDSGYSSMHSMDVKLDERPRTSDGSVKSEQHDTQAIKFEFSNYAQVEVKCSGSKSHKRYEFEYWGTQYTWKRVTRKDGTSQETSFRLSRSGSEEVVANIVPMPLSPWEKQEESAKGGWIPPCSMWIADEKIVNSQKDLSDVIVAAGLIALVDHSIREHFQPTRSRSQVLPRVEYIGPKRFMSEVLRRDSYRQARDRPPSNRQASATNSDAFRNRQSESSSRPASQKR